MAKLYSEKSHAVGASHSRDDEALMKVVRRKDTPASLRFGALAGIVVVALLAAISVSPVSHAQDAGKLRADIASVNDGDYPYARAVINVDDASGADLEHLDASSFAVTVGGAPAAVTAAELASSGNVPLDVLFVIDVSGSMAGEPITRAKEAAKGFVAGLSPNDRVAIITFADDAASTQDFTTDRAATAAAIDGLEANGNTALYRATGAAAFKIGSALASRRAVILLSDGAQDGVPLTTTRQQAVDAARGGGAPFFTIGEGEAIDRDYLQQLAEATHGRYLEAPDPGDLDALYDGIGKLLRSQYVVTFDASAAPAEGAPISVVVNADGATATATATYRPAPNFAPSSVNIEGVKAGEELHAARAITLGGGAALGSRAAYYVDGVNVYETETQPFTYQYDPRSFTDGPHTVKAVVTFGTRTVESEALSFSSTPPAPAEGGGGLPLLPIVGVALLLIIGVPAAIVLMRLRAMQQEGTLAQHAGQWDKSTITLPPPPSLPGDGEPVVPEDIGEPLGILISRSGSDLGSEYKVGGIPVSIGSSPRCGVCVLDEELGAEEARTWIRKGHLMLHRMTKLTTIVNEGTSGGWQILEPGDTFEIGPHTFEFRLLPAAAAEGDAGPLPNVLRDAEPPAPPPQIHAAPSPNQPSTMPSAHGRIDSFSQLMPKND